MTWTELEECICKWGSDRGLDMINPRNQLLKCLEELGELADAELRELKEEQIDAIGDVIVTLILYAQAKRLPSVLHSLEKAWCNIKDRRGKTVNGTFIKDG